MLNREQTIEFLNKLSNLLIKKMSPITTTSEINNLFTTYLNLENAEFIVWDNNSMLLKDFVHDWRIFDNSENNIEVNTIFSNLSLAKGEKFYFNDSEFDCNIDEEEHIQILDLIGDLNIITFPLVSNGEVIGFMRIKAERNKYTKEFFYLLNISSKLISGTIVNYLLNEQMEISLNFYQAMKDIAKIIESQYELSYIIPIIGEMIDRFMSAHLIYIFIYKDEKYQLVWPNACKDPSIYELLNKLTVETEYLISPDEKAGVFPLNSENNIIGAIAAYSNIEKLLQKDIDYLIQLSRQSGLTIQRANMYAEVLKHATLDALTGLNNRRQFEIRINQEVSNCKRNTIPLCGMMLDVDYFKKINDTYGHSAGDCVLKSIAEIITKEIREYDIACRYGGEEFFIILPQTRLPEAAGVAQRLRKVIEDNKIDIEEAGIENITHIKTTVSIGVCEYITSMDANNFIQKADKALYEAKDSGRNRVIVF